MKPVSGIAKISAAAVAISVTFAIVWGMAGLGYPGVDVSIAPLAATPHTRAVQ
jgi:hypothetical protein